MRVIGGEFRSRRLQSLPGMDVRPTPDRVRESLFNILTEDIPGAIFVDAYAGTGAVGIEALSRGALRVYFLEKSKASVEVIRANLKSLGITHGSSVIVGAVLKELGKLRANIVFLDPPFSMEKEYGAALEIASTVGAEIVIAQHSSRFDPGDRHGTLERYRVLRQGDNSLSFYRTAEDAVEASES